MSTQTLPESTCDNGTSSLGLLAGEGAFPLMIARAARSQDVAITAVGIKGVTSPDLESEVSQMHWVRFGQFEHVIRYLHDKGISKTIMAGRVKHNSIFDLARIDRRGLKLMAKMVSKKADSVLGMVTQELAKENIEVIDSTKFVRSCMPQVGSLTPSLDLTEEMKLDIDFGLEHARQIAALDIGQSVVVKSQSVVAVEAMEGTDGAIKRAGVIAGPGTVVVKVNKPVQDRRFDVPVLGKETILSMIEAKASVLAFSGGQVIFFDQEEAVELALRHKIRIVGV